MLCSWLSRWESCWQIKTLFVEETCCPQVNSKSVDLPLSVVPDGESANLLMGSQTLDGGQKHWRGHKDENKRALSDGKTWQLNSFGHHLSKLFTQKDTTPSEEGLKRAVIRSD